LNEKVLPVRATGSTFSFNKQWGVRLP